MHPIYKKPHIGARRDIDHAKNETCRPIYYVGDIRSMKGSRAFGRWRIVSALFSAVLSSLSCVSLQKQFTKDQHGD